MAGERVPSQPLCLAECMHGSWAGCWWWQTLKSGCLGCLEGSLSCGFLERGFPLAHASSFPSGLSRLVTFTFFCHQTPVGTEPKRENVDLVMLIPRTASGPRQWDTLLWKRLGDIKKGVAYAAPAYGHITELLQILAF